MKNNQRSKVKICIVTQSHLCRNPRVLKEALALNQAGFEVSIVNSNYSSALQVEDAALISGTGITVTPVSQLQNRGLQTFTDRVIRKAAAFMVRVLKINTPAALAYGYWRYGGIVDRQRADIYIGHQEIGLYCGVRLLKAKKKVAFDFEDWYSEDLLPEARQDRPIELLRKLEKIALQRGTFSVTTSAAMASILAKRYDAPKPEVIYNGFSADRDLLLRNKTYEGPLKLLWFSQTVGAGRGLEKFLSFAAGLKCLLEFHFLGQIDDLFRSELQQVQSVHPLFFHALVPAAELAKKIAEFDIGLALEEREPPSRDYTITNKFFQYMQSGLPVIATSTAGQSEVFSEGSPGFLLADSYAETQANNLNCWLQDRGMLTAAREKAVGLAMRYRQENEYDKLIILTKNALEL